MPRASRAVKRFLSAGSSPHHPSYGKRIGPAQLVQQSLAEHSPRTLGEAARRATAVLASAQLIGVAVTTALSDLR
jgi:hypothetical protein